MLKHLFNLAKSATRTISEPSPRSPKWPKVGRAHLKLNPTCFSCGSGKKVQVHHVKPFHLHPELELDPTNLISLCMDNDCHLYIGHGDDFKAYNPNVITDSKEINADLSRLKDIAAVAKKNRLFE